MRQDLRSIATTAVTLVALFVAPTAQGEPHRPNVVFILADDLGYGELGCYGQKLIETPNIDRLAAEGMRFTQFYCGSPVCAPSRCVLMTGKHTGHAYIRNNGDPKHLQHMREQQGWEFPGQNPIPESEVTLAEVLQEQGYVTAAAGKWGLGHFGTTGDPNRQGFDLFYGFNCQRHAHNHYPRFLWRNGVKEPLPGNDRTLNGKTYSQDKFTEVALEFIRGNKDRPFFLYLPFAIPHLAIQVSGESLDQYQGAISEVDYESRDNYVRHPTPRAGYAAMVSHMDRDIGKIMLLLQELGLDDETIVLFTSDNGPTYDRLGGADSQYFESAGPLRGRKGSTYEGGIRVPLVARWPQHIAPGSESDLVAAFWDILPTICDLVAATPPSDIDGLSILPTLLSRGEQAQHERLYWEFPAYGGQQAVRLGDWKATRQNMFQGNRTLELYNLADDLGEQNDVADEHPDVIQQIETILETERTDSELFPIFRN